MLGRAWQKLLWISSIWRYWKLCFHQCTSPKIEHFVGATIPLLDHLSHLPKAILFLRRVGISELQFLCNSLGLRFRQVGSEAVGAWICPLVKSQQQLKITPWLSRTSGHQLTKCQCFGQIPLQFWKIIWCCLHPATHQRFFLLKLGYWLMGIDAAQDWFHQNPSFGHQMNVIMWPVLVFLCSCGKVSWAGSMSSWWAKLW